MATASDASGAICISSAQLVANWVKCAGERALAAPSHSPKTTTILSSSSMSCSNSLRVKMLLSDQECQVQNTLHDDLVDTLFSDEAVVQAMVDTELQAF
ncbi:MAG: hypothetical protein NZM04_02580 [Methylacidiphilales bacterium]|nr:hypothetical protein [Candidatus Methylacidiphilales bacterium]